MVIWTQTLRVKMERSKHINVIREIFVMEPISSPDRFNAEGVGIRRIMDNSYNSLCNKTVEIRS